MGKNSNDTASRLIQLHDTHPEIISSFYAPDMLELVLAVASSLAGSTVDHTALVWLVLVANPSSGKTFQVSALKGAKEHVEFVDTITSGGFASAFINPKSGRKPEVFLRKLKGKCLILKDLTTLFSMRAEKVAAALGALQSIFDGDFHKVAGTTNKISVEDCFFTLVGCVTPIVLEHHHRYLSRMGGRFLFYRLPPLTKEEKEKGFELSRMPGLRGTALPKFHQLMVEHLKDVLSRPFPPKDFTDEQHERLERLAELLGLLRSSIGYSTYTEHNEETGREVKRRFISATQPSEPWRGLEQLKTLACALARVHGRERVTDHELELVRRVVLSSGPADWGNVLEAFRLLRSLDGLKMGDFEKVTGRTRGSIKPILDELVAVGIVDLEKRRNDAGLTVNYYLPNAEFKDLLTMPVEPLEHLKELECV